MLVLPGMVLIKLLQPKALWSRVVIVFKTTLQLGLCFAKATTNGAMLGFVPRDNSF